MNVTQIKVVFGDGKKAAEEYAPARKAEVHLTADIAEGADYTQALLDLIKQATANVRVMISDPGATVTVVEPKKQSRTAAKEPAKQPAIEASIAAQIAAKQGADDFSDPPNNPPNEHDAPVMVIDTSLPDPASLEDWEQPQEITDDELLSRITHKNGETKNSSAIKKLVDKFAPGTDRKYQAREIAQDRRAEFLDELKRVEKV